MFPGLRRQYGMERGDGPSASGFTVLEVLIAVAVATLLVMVIFNLFIGGQKLAGRGMETLDFVTKATILLEYVKRDIRGASREADSIVIEGAPPPPTEEAMAAGPDFEMKIKTVDDEGKDIVVTYKYSSRHKAVKREVDGGGKKYFGRGKGGGMITFFSVTPVGGEKYKGFYRIDLAFMPRRLRHKRKRPARVHIFRALVTRRTPTVVDEKWNAAFR